MPGDERAVSGGKGKSDRENIALRPKRLADVTGQDRVRENLSIIIDAAAGRGEPIDHLLFYGPPGLGKTSLAYVVSNEVGANIRITAGPAIERAGDLAAILTHLKKGDILFIDEVHRLGKAVEEILYPAMEDFVLDIVIGKGPAAKTLRLNLPRFTVIGATTRLALLAAPLRDRFGASFRLDFYEQPAMEQIVKRAAGLLEVDISREGTVEIAKRARGTPRVGLRLLRRVRDFAEARADGRIDEDVTQRALELMEIDHLGLDDIDRRILQTIIEKFSGGPVGLETIAAAISEDSATIMDVYEPYLIQLGFIDRTPRGRTCTLRAYKHLDIELSDDTGPDQQRLL
ncbi:MAG: Holliday junction branch migration DNA helicase RuvB [Chloroflexi bacterium]|nr:Holliday junction branch migration DNA helicase RuvB [Chloroflexota bacterium]